MPQSIKAAWYYSSSKNRVPLCNKEVPGESQYDASVSQSTSTQSPDAFAVGERGKLLRVSRTSGTTLEVECDDRDYTVDSYAKELKRIQESSHSHGGLQLVCKGYGILGCFRFLAGFHFLVLTERQFIGSICGHGLFEVKNVQMIPVLYGNSKVSGREQAAEKRYLKLIKSGLDLSKDFLVSYSYRLYHTLQGNLTQLPSDPFDSRFVWNEYLTRSFRAQVSQQWVVPLVHGYLEQKVFSVFGATVQVTLISRRSRFFAGTRYKKRGINAYGQVANDVETEQIVQTGRGSATGRPLLSAVVQMRGSIPLYWSQDASPIPVKPTILLQNFDPLCESTILHFDDLSERYGNPVCVLNLVKRHERTPHERVLGEEYRRVVELLNGKLRPREKYIRYYPFDFAHVSKVKGFDHIVPGLRPKLDEWNEKIGVFVFNPDSRTTNPRCSSSPEAKVQLQSGLLRTNCIDCLDRTNAVQCIYGLIVLGTQLKELELSETNDIDLDSSMAMQIMGMCVPSTSLLPILYKSVTELFAGRYERMGNCLSVQYGGSEAHRQFFHKHRGDWNAAVQSRDLMTSVRRLYSSTMTDAEKQHAMNLFLGNFVPEAGKPAVWELESDSFLHAAGPVRTTPSAGETPGNEVIQVDSSTPKSSQTQPEPSSPGGDNEPGLLGDDGEPLANDDSDYNSILTNQLTRQELTDNAALARVITENLDGLLAQISDLDCAANEVDAGLDQKPLSAVVSQERGWSLFPGQKKLQEMKTSKMHSFDALMSAPQGCPVQVRIKRDTTAKQNSQPLSKLFKNALGLYNGQRQTKGNPSSQNLHPSARSHSTSQLDQSTGLDGRSDVSREMSTTHALSRTLSFMSAGVSENPPSPTGGLSSHASLLYPTPSGNAEEYGARKYMRSRGMVHTRLAGLPLVSQSHISALPQLSSCMPQMNSNSNTRDVLGAENKSLIFPGSVGDLQDSQAGRGLVRQRPRSGRRALFHSKTEIIPYETPLDTSAHMLGDGHTIVSAPLFTHGMSQTHASSNSSLGQSGGGLNNQFYSGPINTTPCGRLDHHKHDTASALLLAGTNTGTPSAAHKQLLMRHSTTAIRPPARPSSPGAFSTASAPLHRLRGDDLGDAAISNPLSENTTALDSYRKLINGSSGMLPLIDEAYLNSESQCVLSTPENVAAQAMQDTLRRWVQEDIQLSRLSQDHLMKIIPDVAFDCSARSYSGRAHFHGTASVGVVTDRTCDTSRDEYQALTSLSFLSDLKDIEDEFDQWMEEYNTVFMSPEDDARIVKQYASIAGSMQPGLCLSPAASP